jgi:hypothetical protein
VTTDRRSNQELPEAVKTLIETRTGDAVYVVGPDYTIVHWDQNMEALSGVLSEVSWENHATRPWWGRARGAGSCARTAAR